MNSLGESTISGQPQNRRIVLLGGAGLVGQNVVAQLIAAGTENVVVIDKSEVNLNVLKSLHPQIETYVADISEPGQWSTYLSALDTVVMLQAQIGGLNLDEFIKNNVQSTQNVLDVMAKKDIRRLVHVSSSVVESIAEDWYTQTKKVQEELVLKSETNFVVLRPTLMFGWFDRKHLGWLSRFMKKVPIFPVPGNGKFMRQPLYARDFARVVTKCVDDEAIHGVYNITGQERIDYIDIIRTIRKRTKAKTLIVCIPFKVFKLLLAIWGKFDSNPPFTADQLTALIARDEFEVIDWPGIFDVTPTPFSVAIDETFNHPVFSSIVLEF